MKSVRIERTLDASRERVWATLADFGGVGRWNPNLASAELLGGPSEGLGARRRCNMKDGKNHIEEVVTGWVEPSRMEIEVTDGTMPFATALISVQLAAVGATQTRVTLTMSYKTKATFAGAAMNLMAGPMLRRMLGQLLDGLEAEARPARPARAAS